LLIMNFRIIPIGLLSIALYACGGSSDQGPTSTDTIDTNLATNAKTVVLAATALPAQSHISLWLKADTGVSTAIDANGNTYVVKWADQSGLGGRDATTQFGQEGPLYVPGVYGLIPALRGDGTYRSLLINVGHGYVVGKASTIFVIQTTEPLADENPANALNGVYTDDVESTQMHQYDILETTKGVAWSNWKFSAIPWSDSGLPTPDQNAAVLPTTRQGDFFYFTQNPTLGLHSFAVAMNASTATGYYDEKVVKRFNPKGTTQALLSVFGGPGDGFTSTDAGAWNVDQTGTIISGGSFNKSGDIEEIIQYDEELSNMQTSEVFQYEKARYPTLH
jgi:hypothetical protein